MHAPIGVWPKMIIKCIERGSGTWWGKLKNNGMAKKKKF